MRASSAARRSSAAARASSSVVKSVALRRHALRQLARRVAEHEAQTADGGTDVGRRVGEPRHFAGAGARGDFGVARELGELPRGHLLAEEERRGVGELVGLVEDHRVARGQELREALVAQHHVGEEEVMVDHDDVGVQRGLSRLEYEAVAVERTVAAEAVVAGRRDQRPDRRVLRNIGELAAVAGLARAGERDDLRQMAGVLARRQPALGCGLFEMVMAHVVGAPLEERQRHRHAQRAADLRQVALEQLILQRLGARGNDDLAAVEQRGDEVRERLAGARAGFGEQRASARRSRARPRRPSRAAAGGSGIRAASGRARRLR